MDPTTASANADADVAAVPPLPSELVELLLTYALRKTKLDCLWEPEPVLQVLNVVSRNDMPNLTKQILWDFAWIDMDVASRLGDVKLLKFLLNWSKSPQGRPLQYTPKAITHACASAHLDILDWWFFESGVKICWNAEAVDEASAQGHGSVLDWWLKSGLHLKYSVKAMNGASANGHVAVLAWWLKHAKTPKYSPAALCSAAKNAHLDTLRWWETSGLPLNAKGMVLHALQSRNDKVMEWVLRMSRKGANAMQGWNILREYSQLSACLIDGRADVLIWIDLFGLQLFSTFESPSYSAMLHTVMQSGSISALEWLRSKNWLRSGHFGIAIASQCGHIHLLDYLHSTMAIDDQVALSPAPINHSSEYWPFFSATDAGHADVLDWLLKHDYPVPTTVDLICQACKTGNLDVVQWWFRYPKYTKYNIQDAVQAASNLGFVHILDFLESKGWIGASKVQLRIRKWTVDVLEWWHRRSPQLLCEAELAIEYSMANSLEMLDWWVSHGLKYSAVDAIDLCEDATGNGRLEFLRWCHEHNLIESPIDAEADGDGTYLVCHEGSLRNLVLGMNWWLEQPDCHGPTRKILLQDWEPHVPALLLANLERKRVFSRSKIEWEWEHYDTSKVSLESLVTAGDIASLDCIVRLDLPFFVNEEAEETVMLEHLGATPATTFALLNLASELDHLPLLAWWKEVLPQYFFVPDTSASIRQATKWSAEVKAWWHNVRDSDSAQFPRIPVDLS